MTNNVQGDEDIPQAVVGGEGEDRGPAVEYLEGRE